MINLLVANFRPHGRTSREELERLLCAQIDNSLEVGWNASQIMIVTNFGFEHAGVRATEAPLNETCLTGSKMFAVEQMLTRIDDQVIWAHDLDAWQNHWFEAPRFKDIGICEYSRPKFNGGSVFYRASAIDLVRQIIEVIQRENLQKEEPAINRVLRSKANASRVTTLNSTFNLGCSGYVPRYQRSQKPILVSHLHPTNRIAWDTHVHDRNRLGEVGMAPRLVALLERTFRRGTTCA